MYRILSVAITGLCVSASLAAADPMPRGPQTLTAIQLDQVTAGDVVLNLISAAVSSGSSFALTSTGGGAVTTHNTLPGGGFTNSGLVGGTASAVGSTGSTNGAVVTTSGAVSNPIVNQTVGGTVTMPNGQVSVGFTYVSGGTYFLP